MKHPSDRLNRRVPVTIARMFWASYLDERRFWTDDQRRAFVTGIEQMGVQCSRDGFLSTLTYGLLNQVNDLISNPLAEPF